MVGNNIVTCQIPYIDETGISVAAPIVSDNAIPSRFRPSSDILVIINTFDNVSLVGRYTIDSSGIFTIDRDKAITNFFSDVNQKGFRRTCFSYLLN